MADPPGTADGRPKPDAWATGTASVAVAGNNLAPINTNVFVGDWYPLRHTYLDPSTLKDDLNLDEFVGREWLMREIDSFIAANPSGYFLLEADAGLGKTAIAAHLAIQGCHASHFTCLDAQARETGCAVRNLAAQLIAAWNLTDLAPHGVLPPGSERPSWLKYVLTRVAACREAAGTQTPVILVVDGLDEALRETSDNLPLGLPTSLPAGIYVVATMRTGFPIGAIRQPYCVYRISASDSNNMQDMYRRISAAVDDPVIAQRLRSADVAADWFADILLQRSGGVWIYLHYLLAEISLGLRDPADIEELPSDLESYYAQNCELFRREPGWINFYKPLFATLSSARESVGCTRLAAFAGIDDPERVRSFMCGPFRPFCDVTMVSGEEQFSLYHETLREFFAGSGQGTVLMSLSALRSELARATREAHARICDQFLASWGRAQQGLPLLLDEPERATLHGGYGVRYLIYHLQAANREQELESLVASVGQERNALYRAHHAAGDLDRYLADVDRACRIAENATRDSLRAGLMAPSLASETRYALTKASIVSMAGGIPPALLTALISSKTWTAAQTIGHIGRIIDPELRATSYITVIPFLPQRHRASVRRDALSAARLIPVDAQREKLLLRLIPFLSHGLRQSVFRELRQARRIDRHLYRTELVIASASRMPSTVAGHALSWAQQMKQPHATRVVATIAGRLPPELLPDAITMLARVGTPDDDRIKFLLSTASRLPADALVDALSLADKVAHTKGRADAIAKLVSSMPDEHRTETVLGLLRTCRSDPSPHPYCLGALARYLPFDERSGLLDKAIESCSEIADPAEQIAALVGLAPYLPSDKRHAVASRGLDQLEMISDRSRRLNATCELASFLPHDTKRRLLLTAVDTYTRIGDTSDHLDTLTALLDVWPTRQLTKAITTIASTSDERRLASLLEPIASRLSGTAASDALGVAMRMTSDVDRAEAIAAIAGCVPAEDAEAALDAAVRISVDREQIAAELHAWFSGGRDGLLSPAASSCVNELCRPESAPVSEWGRLSHRYRDRDHRSSVASFIAKALDIHADRTESAQARVISALASRLEGAVLERALLVVNGFRSPYRRAAGLWALSRRFGEPRAGQLRHDVVRALQEMPNAWTRASILTDLLCASADAPSAADACDHLIDEIDDIVDGHRLEDIAHAMPLLPLKQRDRLLKAALSASSYRLPEPERVTFLIRLAQQCPEPDKTDVIREALEAAKAIRDADKRFTALLTLLPMLDPAERGAVGGMALAITASWPTGPERVRANIELCPYLSGTDKNNVLEEGILDAISIINPREQCDALTALLPHLSADKARRIFRDAISIAKSMQSAENRSRALLAIGEHAPIHFIDDLIDAAANISEEQYSLDTLTALANRACDGQLNKIVSLVLAAPSDELRANAIVRLAPKLHMSQLLVTQSAIEAIAHPYARLDAADAILRRLRKMPGAEPGLRAYTPFRAWADGLGRDGVCRLIQAEAWWIRATGGDDAVIDTALALRDVARWWP